MTWREAQLPVVDLQRGDAAMVMAEACRTHGFFLLTNHGVDMVPEVMRQTRSFFALPRDVKMACSDKEHSTGYLPPFHEILDPDNQSIAESKEGYHIRRDPQPGENERDPFAVPNRWPTDAAMPGWRGCMETYFNTMLKLGMRVSEVLATGLGLQQDFFTSNLHRSMSVLRLLRYTPELSDVDKGIIATGAHSDYGLLTFLAADDVGLQVELDGEWLTVPRADAYVVNLGDMLAHWTNDALRSTRHRVVNFTGRERYSAPFFLEPDFDAVVECLPQFVSDARPARYGRTTSGAHNVAMYNSTRTETSPAVLSSGAAAAAAEHK